MTGIWVPPQRIRAVVIGIIRRDAEILAMEINDHLKDQILGYRPPGGEIDFGEASEIALAREMQEELGAEIEVGEVLTVVENRYQLNGGSGHEFVIAREARFLDQSIYSTDEFTIVEPADDGGEAFVNRTIWVPLSGTQIGPLLPLGLADVI
jgi:ADP-ribose pyrophosphatase YjhB (NUDIX family)